GFALSAIVFGVNGMQSNFPDWPNFVLNITFNSLFTERPWNAMDYMPMWLSLAGIGFAYFLPADLLFSLWFFFLLTRFQSVLAVVFGGMPRDMGTTHASTVWTGYQAAGAYVALILAQLRIGWPYFKQVWRTAFGKEKPLDDSSELMSYRTAFIGLFVGYAAIILWLSLAGMNPLLAAAQMGIYLFIIAIIMARGVAEAGLLMTETSFRATEIIRLVYPLEKLGATNLSLMSLMDIMIIRDLRGMLLSPLLDNQKMAGELRLKQRSLLLPFALAVLIAFVVAAYFFLYFNYTRGGLTLYRYPEYNSGNMYRLGAAAIQGSAQPIDATAYGGFALGIIATTWMVWMRANFLWFPLHPLGYALAPTWSMVVFWFPFFVAWVIKSLVLRFGGVDTYRRLSPFMLGMILGEFTLAIFWAMMNMWRGWSTPGFPWP
ncbi:MAG: hypothetical protein M3347_05550, partial [Armatimonadota bacterium]|nr:hypothetical protein [Armatimonadota bacterium]